MIVQANSDPRIWGSADPLEKIKVTYLGKTLRTEADRSGKWQVFLGKIAPNTSFDLQVQGVNQVVVSDVLAGEVWMCAGQSNMAFTLAEATGGFGELTSKAPPAIRFFRVDAHGSSVATPEVVGKWEIFEKNQPAKWSAVGYFFAKKLGERLNEPVGMIEAAYGGSKIQPWMSAESLKGLPVAMLSTFQRNNSNPLEPSTLFNSMVNGLTRYTISGITWYQGESNVHEPEVYRNLFPMMIADWRRRWDSPNLPFLFVQLPTFGDVSKSRGEWCQLRDAQTSALKLKDTAMVVAIDTSDGRVHPPNKQPIGFRLALAALAIGYGKSVCYQGPILESASRVGTAVVCNFKPTANPLKMMQGNILFGFEISGPDQRFLPAAALIKGDKVVVASNLVPFPTAVRYDWGDNPRGNLANTQDFPAAPFQATFAGPAKAPQPGAAKMSAAELGAFKQRYREEMLEKNRQNQLQKHSSQ